MQHSVRNLPEMDDRWIIARRGPRNDVGPTRPYAYMVEPERTSYGTVEDVATIFITNRECPFRCLMCDLWKNTTQNRVPDGAVASQVEWALCQLPPARSVKLYNSGNFFDAQAVPRTDWPRIAECVADFDTVVVECHPRLVDQRCFSFAEMLRPSLHVALGLETVDPDVLPLLNKRMTLTDFEHATAQLLQRDIAVRAFILLRTPFQSEAQGIEWAKKSIDYAFSIGVECCAVIPTRAGNGAMDALAREGHYTPPTMSAIEVVLDYGVGLGHGRVFMDLWDIGNFAACGTCRAARIERLSQINLAQRTLPAIECHCVGTTCES